LDKSVAAYDADACTKHLDLDSSAVIVVVHPFYDKGKATKMPARRKAILFWFVAGLTRIGALPVLNATYKWKNSGCPQCLLRLRAS